MICHWQSIHMLMVSLVEICHPSKQQTLKRMAGTALNHLTAEESFATYSQELI